MANPWHHSVSSARKWGGSPEDYLHVHEWFDETKGWLPDFRHRAIRHHSEGIAEAVKLFDPIRIRIEIPVEESSARLIGALPGQMALKEKVIPIRWVAEQHVAEDLGLIPTAADWLRGLTTLQPWMTRNARKLSVEQEQEEGTNAGASITDARTA